MPLEPHQPQGQEQFAQDPDTDSLSPSHLPSTPFSDGDVSDSTLQQDLLSWKQVIGELPRHSLKSFIGDFPSSAEGKDQIRWSVIGLQLCCFVLIITMISVIRVALHLDTLSRFIDGFVATPLFILFIGLQYLLAKAFGGVGTFKQQVFNSLLFSVPLVLVFGLLSLIPFPAWVNDLLGFYVMGLTFSSIQAVHRLSSFRAICVLFIPSMVGGVILFAFLFTGL